MPTLTTHFEPSGASASTLHVALDLGNTTWCLAGATSGVRGAARAGVPGAHVTAFVRGTRECPAARWLSARCAGHALLRGGGDGFWLQRACTAAGITALVVDSSSIEVSRRARQAKTDRLDATALLRLLSRHAAGERRHWRVFNVPTVEEEDRRHPHRELGRLTRERTRALNQIKGLLAAHGIVLPSLRGLPDLLPRLTQWDGQALPAGMCERLLTRGRDSRWCSTSAPR